MALSFSLGWSLRLGVEGLWAVANFGSEGRWVLELGVLVIALLSRVLGAGAYTLEADIYKESSKYSRFRARGGAEGQSVVLGLKLLGLTGVGYRICRVSIWILGIRCQVKVVEASKDAPSNL